MRCILSRSLRIHLKRQHDYMCIVPSHQQPHSHTLGDTHTPLLGLLARCSKSQHNTTPACHLRFQDRSHKKQRIPASNTVCPLYSMSPPHAWKTPPSYHYMCTTSHNSHLAPWTLLGGRSELGKLRYNTIQGLIRKGLEWKPAAQPRMVGVVRVYEVDYSLRRRRSVGCRSTHPVMPNICPSSLFRYASAARIGLQPSL